MSGNPCVQYWRQKYWAKVRVAFRIRGKIIQTVKMSFKNIQKDTQEHANMCEGWGDECRGLELDQLEDTVQIFTRILKAKRRQLH